MHLCWAKGRNVKHATVAEFRGIAISGDSVLAGMHCHVAKLRQKGVQGWLPLLFNESRLRPCCRVHICAPGVETRTGAQSMACGDMLVGGPAEAHQGPD